jgi:hypothetical protein
MFDLKVGDTVFWVKKWNKKETGFATVTRIGRKYFYLDVFRARFYKETMLEDAGDYTPLIKIYKTQQEYLDEFQRTNLIHEFDDYFSLYHSRSRQLSLEQLKQIKQLISQFEESN